jgi:hypothetical protein
MNYNILTEIHTPNITHKVFFAATFLQSTLFLHSLWYRTELATARLVAISYQPSLLFTGTLSTNLVTQLSSLQPLCMDQVENTVCNSNSIAVEACLPCHYIATAVVSLFVSRSLRSSGSICHSMLNDVSFVTTICLFSRNFTSARATLLSKWLHVTLCFHFILTCFLHFPKFMRPIMHIFHTIRS